MSKDSRLYLDDILEAISNIQEYTAGLTYPAFQEDRKTRDAVLRNLEVIGEAARCLPEDVKSAAPAIEWRKIIALRNMLIHEYSGVNLAVVWDVVQNKLGVLQAACRVLLEGVGPE